MIYLLNLVKNAISCIVLTVHFNDTQPREINEKFDIFDK